MTTGTEAAEPESNDFRARLLAALEASIIEVGYQKTTVADIVRRAHTSRRTFYEHFTSRDDCFVALLTQANGRQVERVAASVDPQVPWRQQVRQAIEAWIASGDAYPELMLSWIRDVPTLGAVAHRLRRDTLANFIVMAQSLSDTEEFRAAGIKISRARVIMLLGGLRELTAITIENGGRMADITEEAVEAALVMLEPRA